MDFDCVKFSEFFSVLINELDEPKINLSILYLKHISQRDLYKTLFT